MQFALAPSTRQRPVPFKNASGEEIPAFAVLRPAGAITLDGEAVLLAGKPNTHGDNFVFVNGPQAVPAEGFGSCTQDFPTFAAYEGSPPNPGAICGPEAGSWALKPQQTGFRILGLPGGGRVWVTRDETTWRTIDFALASTLSLGGSASATVLANAGLKTPAVGSPVTVVDTIDTFSGSPGRQGKALWNPLSKQWEIWQLQCTAAGSPPEEPACDVCGSGSGPTPSTLSLTVSGITDGTCSLCADLLNGEFELTYDPLLPGGCTWRSGPINLCGETVHWQIRLEADSHSPPQYHIYRSLLGSSTQIEFEPTHVTGPTPFDLCALTIPLAGMVQSSTGTSCQASGSTAVLSA